MPETPFFEVGRVYRRRQEIHSRLGGQQQGGISTPDRFPMVLLFSGPRGREFGYQDGFQSDGTFWYTGEGQIGDMEMARGNRAIHDHVPDGKSLHLFEEAGRGSVRYVGEAEYLGDHRAQRPDRTGKERVALVFELGVISEADQPTPIQLDPVTSAIAERRLWSRPLAEVRALALSRSRPEATVTERRALVRARSEAVRVYVLRRAKGICESCNEAAPFRTAEGRPYLEAHHLRRLADSGPDDPRWVAGVCPNCHRAAHYAGDHVRRNQRLGDVVGAREDE
jgi:5-methylcytosine-specific restriction enzyme A